MDSYPSLIILTSARLPILELLLFLNISEIFCIEICVISNDILQSLWVAVKTYWIPDLHRSISNLANPGVSPATKKCLWKQLLSIRNRILIAVNFQTSPIWLRFFEDCNNTIFSSCTEILYPIIMLIGIIYSKPRGPTGPRRPHPVGPPAACCKKLNPCFLSFFSLQKLNTCFLSIFKLKKLYSYF